MAIYPPGILSFLYNVMNDTEMNEKFRNQETRYDVMEFFMLNDELRRIFEDATKRFYDKKYKIGNRSFSYEEVGEFAKEEFTNYKDTDVKILLKAIEEELKQCYGRFW
jgi:hypothetical protein